MHFQQGLSLKIVSLANWYYFTHIRNNLQLWRVGMLNGIHVGQLSTRIVIWDMPGIAQFIKKLLV